MSKKTYVARRKRRASPKSPKNTASKSSSDFGNEGTKKECTRLVWSLIDFETCRPVITDAGELKLGETAHHAIDVEGCLGGVFQFKDPMGIVGTLVAFPGMHPEAFVQKFDRGDADEFTYIVKDGVKEFASVVKEEV